MTLDTRQRAYSWEDQEATRLASIAQDGLAVLHAIGDGTLPLPPAVRTLGIEPVQAEAGRVSFTLELGEYHLNPFGIVHGGVLAALLDTAMGCAVHSLLPPAVGYVTGELNVRFLRPAVLTGGTSRVHRRGGPPREVDDGGLRTGRRRRRPGHRPRRSHLPGAETVMLSVDTTRGGTGRAGDTIVATRAGPARHVASAGTLILGGGFGGAHVARLLPSATIVSPESSMLYTPLLPEVAAGALEPRHAFVPLREMCPDAELLRGRVTGLDEATRTVTVATDVGDVDVSYRRLVIALGAVARTLPIPGLAQHAMTFKDLGDAIRLRNHVLRQLDLAEADPANATRYLTFVFVGAGYAGVEALAEVRQLVQDALHHYRALGAVPQRWVLVDSGAHILAEVPRQLADHASARLQRHGVEIWTSTTIASVEATRREPGRRQAPRQCDLGVDGRSRHEPAGSQLGASARPTRPDPGRLRAAGRGTLGHLGSRGLCRRTQRSDAGETRSAHLPARRPPGSGAGRVARRCDRRRTPIAASERAPPSDVVKELLGSFVCTSEDGSAP